MTASLTVSGNEITDAVRTTATSGDGLAIPAGYGIWEAATNLHTNGGYETNANGVAAELVSTSVIGSATAGGAKFGTKACEIDSIGAGGQMAVTCYRQDSSRVPVSAGTSYTFSVWAWMLSAYGTRSCQLKVVWYNGAGGVISTTTGTSLNLAAGVANAQQLTASATAPVGAATARPQIFWQSTVAGERYFHDGVQFETGLFASPFIPTDGATASRSAARVRAPSSLVNATQGWLFARVTVGFASTDTGTRRIASWRDDDNNRGFDISWSGGNFTIDRYAAGSHAAASVASGTFSAGTTFTVAAAWTASTVKVSVNGGAFTSAANTYIPTLAATTFDIGSYDGATGFIDGTVRWLAVGTGTLTDGDAAALATLAASTTAAQLALEDVNASATAAACTAVWPAATSTYQNEAFYFIADNAASLPRIRVDIDFTNDPTSASTTWTDVTGDVVSYGRNPVRSNEFDQPQAATGSLTLRNDQGQYIPDNTAGTYYGKLKRLRRVRVRARWAGVDYNRFWGYVDDWPQSWDGYGRDQSVTLNLVDALEPLSRFDLVGQSLASANSGSAVATVLALAGATAGSIETGLSTIAASGTITGSMMALQRVNDITATENGVCFANGGGSISFHARSHRLLQSSTVQGTIGDASGEIPYVSPQPLYGDVWNVVNVTAYGGTMETTTVAASTASYFKRTLTFPTSGDYLVSSQAEAAAASQFLANRYSAPATRVNSVEVVAGRQPTLWPTVFGLDTGTRVLFKRRFLSNGTIAGTVSLTEFVEGYGDQVQVASDWRVTLPLSPADLQTYWVLGDATYSLLGQSTYLFY